MSVIWNPEGCDRYNDPQSGALVASLTTSCMTSYNIYHEQPPTSPDGQRIAFLRTADFSFEPQSKLLVGDLPRLRIGLVETAILGGVSTASWSGYVFYRSVTGALTRLNIATLERHVYPFSNPPELSGGSSSVSPDLSFLIAPQVQPGCLMGVLRLDLNTGERKVIFTHPEITNPHLQIHPVHGRKILIQHNRGSRLNPDGTRQTVGHDVGLLLIDADGGNLQELPIGGPHTGPTTGHECFLGDTGKILVTCNWNRSTWEFHPTYRQGNLFIITPGQAQPRVFVAPEHRFNHVGASRCGKYFVADSHHGGALFDEQQRIRAVSIVIGNIASGKYRTLVTNSGASGGGAQASHCHPYLTADNKRVVFNSDQMVGVTQIYFATIPEGFLASLE